MQITRKYEESHPWLKFEFSLADASYRLWLLLGECASKVEHIAGVPLNPELRKKLHGVYLAKGVHATTAIEGNQLSESQVQLAIDGILEPLPSQSYQQQEVRNVIRMCNRISDQVFVGKPVQITPRLIKYLNRGLMFKLPPRPDCSCKPGEISEHPVVVGNVYRGAPREDCDFLLQRLCDWLNGPRFQSDDLDPTVLAIVKATIAHLYIAWIHPFCDGNGRTARLLELWILLSANVPSAAGHLLSNHYNATRNDYYAELARTSRSGGDVMPFIFYAVQGLRDQLKEQISWVREQQIDAAWLKFAEQKLIFQSPAKAQRQLTLIAGIGQHTVPIDQLLMVSVSVALAYGKRSISTLNRDLVELESYGLISIDPDTRAVRANRELILELLPRRKDRQSRLSVPETSVARKPGRPKKRS